MACMFLLASSSIVSAQATREFAKLTSDGNPTGNGPVYTTAINFLRNTNNPGNTFALLNPVITATFTYSNQQYTNVPGLPSGAVVMGHQSGASTTIYTLMSGAGVPGGIGANSDYTSGTTAGAGIDLTQNYAVRVSAYVQGIGLAQSPALGSYYMADLTISFNQPVSNPVIQIGGGSGASGFGNDTQGITTEFKLKTSNTPVTFSKLSGTSYLSVTNDSIYHNSADLYGTAAYFLYGSVRVNGTGITSITLKQYIRGDGGRNTPSYTDWGAAGFGDAFLMGLSLPDNLPPVANNNTLTNQIPGGAAIVPNILIDDTDPESGALRVDSVSLVAPGGATNVITDAQGDVTSFRVTNQGTWTLNSDGTVSFTPVAGFTGDPIPITYTVTDLAGASSNPATIAVDYSTPAIISGIIYNDNDGTTSGAGGTTMPAGVAVTLYAANGTTVLATTTTDAAGAYSFTGIVPGNYVVAVTAPGGYSHVSSTDATPANGRTDVTITGVTNQPAIHFGVNQPPSAGAGSSFASTPSSTTQVPVPPNTFANTTTSSDAGSGIVSGISLTALPSNAASVIVNGTQYFANNATHVAALIALVIPANTSGEPTVTITVDPDFNTTGSIVFSFVAVDNAGLRSANTGTATMVFNTVMPVKLLYFNATAQHYHALLKWATASEQNNKGFEIQRSADGQTWSAVGFINTKVLNGTSNVQQNYEFADNNPLHGKSYYRLKQTDFDGKFEYSDVRSLQVENNKHVKVFPNPITRTVTVSGLNRGETIYLYSMAGQKLKILSVLSQIEVIDLSTLNPALYTLIVASARGKIISIHKIMKKAEW